MSGSLIRSSRVLMLVAAGTMALSMAAAGGAQAATAAPAAQKCTIKSYTPSKFVVAAKDTERKFSVKTSGCTQKSWKVTLVDDTDSLLLATKAKPYATLSPTGLENAAAGKYHAVVTVKSTDDKTTKKDFTFYLQRRSTFGTTFNVGPEPAAKGDTLKVVASLERVSWGASPSYKPYAGRTVQVQFRAVGAKSYVTVKNAKTDADGNVATTVPAKKSGYWRLSYKGNTTTGAALSAVDGVKVS